MRYLFITGLLLLLMGCDTNSVETTELGVATVVEAPKIPERTVVIASADAIFALFDELHYTHKEWVAGSRLVPRIYMAGIPARWQETSHKLTVAKKKELFFRLLAPLVLHANEVIAKDRARLLSLNQPFESLAQDDSQWLLSLARSYKMSKPEETSLSAKQIAELRLRVDSIPVSLALAQGAEESGWATSRFAVLGNALFGQWDFSGDGIRPERQRTELGNYGLARFDTPLDSVISYMRNLNTHRAYAGMRHYRAKLRQGGQEVTGYELARKLDKYSERGPKYVDGLHTIMRVNHLAHTDEAHLSDKEIIYIIHNPS